MNKSTSLGAVLALQIFYVSLSHADPAANPQVVPVRAPERKVSLEPKAAELKPPGRSGCCLPSTDLLGACKL